MATTCRDEPPGPPVTLEASEPPSPLAGDNDSDEALLARHRVALAAYDSSRGTGERLVLRVYVDNLQIIHSACARDATSQYATFMTALARDWDVEDEGEM